MVLEDPVGNRFCIVRSDANAEPRAPITRVERPTGSDHPTSGLVCQACGYGGSDGDMGAE